MSMRFRVRDPTDFRRLDALEKTLASMRQSIDLHDHSPQQHQHLHTSPVVHTVDGSFAGNTFGHPLDMLARTAANTHSPEVDPRFQASHSVHGITIPPPRPSPGIGPSESIPTSWTTDLSGVDPIDRGWLDMEDARNLFER